jgi:hypothetical protein
MTAIIDQRFIQSSVGVCVRRKWLETGKLDFRPRVCVCVLLRDAAGSDVSEAGRMN